MKSPVVRKSSAGFSIFELLIVLMVTVITGYGIVRFRSSQVAISRVNAAQEFVAHLEQARLDSNRRQTNIVDQMACVTVVDNKTYSYIIDANSDGRLDPPKNITIATANSLRIKGPFPKTFRFDSLGRIVDPDNNVVEPSLVIFTNSRGTSTVRLSAGGKPVVLHGPQPGIGVQR
jgi:type II secretory pathway pseudopilin PulG